jgi:hypothetical protein
MAMKSLLRCAAALLGVALVGGIAPAQYPQYCPPAPAPSPYNYPGPANPIRVPQAFGGSSYGFQPPGSASYYPPPPPTYSPFYSSFYDPHLIPRYQDPGPYWYTRHYPFTNGYYSYYYTPGYFRY